MTIFINVGNVPQMMRVVHCVRANFPILQRKRPASISRTPFRAGCGLRPEPEACMRRLPF